MWPKHFIDRQQARCVSIQIITLILPWSILTKITEVYNILMIFCLNLLNLSKRLLAAKGNV